jgi:flagellar hook-basal body complex protein FliE
MTIQEKQKKNLVENSQKMNTKDILNKAKLTSEERSEFEKMLKGSIDSLNRSVRS